MARYQTRTRLSGTCPRCGAPLRLHEVGHMVEELPEPVNWSVSKRECSRGCLLTVDDFGDQ